MTLVSPPHVPERTTSDVQALKLQRRQTRRLKLFEPALVRMAMFRSFAMLDPRNMARNPVMFLVEAGWVLTTVISIGSIASGAAVGLVVYQVSLAILLLLTVLFANFAEALAEARGKAQAQSLRATRQDTMALRIEPSGDTVEVSSTVLKTGDRVIVEAGQIIPADGEIVEGLASVDESAITGASAPVIREAGGVRSGGTGGTRVLADRSV
ncbi:MAG: P-type ATPase, partial [Isosphaeraceae bacterium]